ncbi:MAG: KH domain-containing protein [Bacilli bacterium]|nr:KH domain-containing protein [Bacilli bacterium]
MEVKEFEGKNLENLIEESLQELNTTKDEVIIVSEEIKGNILKKSSFKIKIYTLIDIQNYIKEYLKSLTDLMGLEVSFESKIRDNQIYIKMYSDNNSILIGKEGKTLSSLMLIVKQMLSVKYNICPHILLDVENYKENQEKKLERLAKKMAREVINSKIDVKLDNMNSYERRIIHNVLSNNNKVVTISEGEEPNRHVVIKLK